MIVYARRTFRKTSTKAAAMIAALLISSAALAAELPPAVPPVQKIDPADQLVRTMAVANALYRDKQQLESQIVGLESDNASIEAKLNAALAQAQELQKQLDDAKKALDAPVSVPTPTPK